MDISIYIYVLKTTIQQADYEQLSPIACETQETSRNRTTAGHKASETRVMSTNRQKASETRGIMLKMGWKVEEHGDMREHAL